ncbi:MAG: hypothetical protein FWF70_03985 [Bacteroidetes bacterium]|nr:hypothetical protein [Bacteroidota bacterium]MCL1968053.1 hypothetical protein [Bacteroidota bacterium]
MIAENKKRSAKNDREWKKSCQKFDRRLDKLHREVGGIANNNGEMAEEYFYSTFKANKTFANEKFDKVKRNLICESVLKLSK